MKVRNMTGRTGRDVPNQFVIEDSDGNTVFQSYDSVIARIGLSTDGMRDVVTLDEKCWDYSSTTGKYRNKFLGEDKKTTQAKIDSGEYILADLN